MNELVKLGIDLYRNTVKQYSKDEANEVLRKAFIDLIGTENPDYRHFREQGAKIFAIIEEVLDQVITDGIQTPFFDQFVEYRDVNFGDANEFYVEDRSMLVVARHSGNHWDIRRQKLNVGDSFVLQTEAYVLKIYADFKRFLAGRIDWTKMVDKVAEAVTHELNSRIYTEFMATINYLPTEFKYTGTYSEQALLDLAEHVQAANQGSQIIIAGTRSALSKLKGADTLLSEQMKNELNQLGVLRNWNGYTLLPIPQSHKPNTFEFQIDNNRLMVLPSNTKPIKVVREGRPFIKEITDGITNQDMSMEYGFVTFYGVGSVFNVMYGMYQMS